MKIEVEPLIVKFKHPFGISRWTRTVSRGIIVRVSQDGITGLGEASPNQRYGETLESSTAFAEGVPLPDVMRPEILEETILQVWSKGEGEYSAKAAIDMALFDWVGKVSGKPLYRMWGKDKPHGVTTSFTLGIDTPDVMRQKAEETGPYRVLKLKVGTDSDHVNFEAVRSVTDKVIRVDANEGWKDKHQALDRIHWLNEQNVELVEQPMPAGSWDDLAWLKQHSPLPLFADEDCGRLAGMEKLSDAYHGVNIKLDKSGGLLEAKKMLEKARELDMQVMIGCMTGTSVSMSAGTHLALWADYADLDGHLLIADDPFEGVELRDGQLWVREEPGLGVSERNH